MSDYDSGFARAQAQYDAQMPPEWDECPVCDGAEYDEDDGDCPHRFYQHEDARDSEADELRHHERMDR